MAGSPLQNFLSAAADTDEAAFAGAPGLEAVLIEGTGKQAQNVVLQGNAFVGLVIGIWGKPCLLSRHRDAHLGGRRKRVSLHMVDI